VPDHPHLSVLKQCKLLRIARSSYYYQPQSVSEEELTLLRLVDHQYLETPFYGSRRIMLALREKGYNVNRKRVQRLMRQLGIEAVYPKPRLSHAAREHQVYPYLLRNLDITKANQVWYTDITYLPVLKGHFYLVAMMDWFSRMVLSWQISNTLEGSFCIEALQNAIGLPSRRESPDTEYLKSSIQTREVNLPLMGLSDVSRAMALISAWMGEADVMTIFSLSSYDAR
jgi:putative transposase